MKKYLQQLGNEIYKTVQPFLGDREIYGRAADGDLHFKLDEIAERGMESALKGLSREGLKFAYFSEKDGKLIFESERPDYLYVIDVVDGSRPAICGFPQWCVNIASAPYSENPTVGDVQYAFMKEADGTEYIAERGNGASIIINGSESGPSPSTNREISGSSLIIEVCGSEQTIGSLINIPLIKKAWPTGVFLVNSSSWTIGQLSRGKIDGYVHPTKRIFDEFPEYREKILQESGGKLKGLFPYDIAPWNLIGTESGLVITDSYGNSLDNMSLVDISAENQRCVVAAGTEELHKEIMNTVNSRIDWIKERVDLGNLIE